MWHTANAVVSGLVVTATLVVGLMMLGISMALMWGEFSEHTRMMLKLLRVVFPYMLLVCLAAVFMGMLNSRGFFFIRAMGATLLNVVMIATVLFVAPSWGELEMLGFSRWRSGRSWPAWLRPVSTAVAGARGYARGYAAATPCARWCAK